MTTKAANAQQEDYQKIYKESAIKKQIASVELQGGAWLQNVKIVDGDGNPVTYEFSKVEGGNALTPEESALLK